MGLRIVMRSIQALSMIAIVSIVALPIVRTFIHSRNPPCLCWLLTFQRMSTHPRHVT